MAAGKTEMEKKRKMKIEVKSSWVKSWKMEGGMERNEE
jgi:hypothetical protein